jgi:hypothetical protein
MFTFKRDEVVNLEGMDRYGEQMFLLLCAGIVKIHLDGVQVPEYEGKFDVLFDWGLDHDLDSFMICPKDNKDACALFGLDNGDLGGNTYTNLAKGTVGKNSWGMNKVKFTVEELDNFLREVMYKLFAGHEIKEIL